MRRSYICRSPFRMERTMRVEASRPVLLLRERITNECGEPIDYMWGHHPSYGPPFLSDACRIDIGARTLRADDSYDGPTTRWRRTAATIGRSVSASVPICAILGC